jgi:hypothetical protein
VTAHDLVLVEVTDRVATVVADAVLLLVGGVVFLVDPPRIPHELYLPLQTARPIGVLTVSTWPAKNHRIGVNRRSGTVPGRVGSWLVSRPDSQVG